MLRYMYVLSRSWLQAGRRHVCTWPQTSFGPYIPYVPCRAARSFAHGTVFLSVVSARAHEHACAQDWGRQQIGNVLPYYVVTEVLSRCLEFAVQAVGGTETLTGVADADVTVCLLANVQLP